MRTGSLFAFGILLLFISVYAACRYTTASLTTEDLEMIPYESGYSIKFISDSGKVEVLFVDKSERHYLGYQFLPMFSPYNGIWNPEMLTVMYHHPNSYYMSSSRSSKPFIELLKHRRNEVAQFQFNLFTFYSFSRWDTLNFNRSIRFDNQVYDDIEIFSNPCSNPNYDWNKIHPSEVYWSKRSGVVMFIECNGLTWRLQK